ncbi:MAG: efflux RND transporter periplasmic adaptor subunit [Alphaproteobacteria bacterium]
MNKNIKIAIVILLMIIGWMMSGVFFNDKNTKKEFKRTNSIKIETKLVKAQNFNPVISIPAQIKSEQSILIKSQAPGNIDSIKVKAGDFVKKGTLLMVINGAPAKSILNQAKISFNEASIKYKTDKALYKKKLLSKSGFENSKFNYARAKTNLENSKNNYNNHYIKAPFTGHIGIIRKKANEFVYMNEDLIDIENKSKYQVIAFVSIKQKHKINNGDKFKFNLNEKEYIGTVKAISSTPEPVVKTYRLVGDIENDDFTNGEPIKIKIKLKSTMAHFVPSSLFNVDPDGDLAIKILNASNKVEFKKVTILQENLDGSWVSGLDAETTILTDGAGFAKIGDVIQD